MNKDSELENKLNLEPHKNSLDALCSTSSGAQINSYGKAYLAIKNYLVDTTAAWLFYTPVMASVEYFVAGMEPKEVAKSRLLSIASFAS